MNRSEFAQLDVKEGDDLVILLKCMVFRGRFVSLAAESDSDTITVTSQDPGQPEVLWVLDLYDASAIGKVVVVWGTAEPAVDEPVAEPSGSLIL